MSLSISVTQRHIFVCPKCGDVVGHTDVQFTSSGGRGWYEFLEKIGYYVPHDQVNEDNDWYGKDMTLSDETAREMYQFLQRSNIYNEGIIRSLISDALMENDSVVINADW